MKRLIVFVFITTITITLYAQDVIVKKDGSTVVSKVLEVNRSDIKYKKFTNQKGPTYTISKSEVASINYPNGDIDKFNDTGKQASVEDENQTSGGLAKPSIENAGMIKRYNNHDLSFKIKKKNGKKADHWIGFMGIDTTSVLVSDQLEVTIKAPSYCDLYCDALRQWPFDGHYYFVFKNCTDKTLYIDLGNTFRVDKHGNYKVYYDTKQTTVTQGSGSGASMNIGSVVNAIGINGVLGGLANGINVGANSSASASTTYSKQRVIAIPPKGQRILEKCDWEWVKSKRIYLSYCEGFDYSPLSISVNNGEIKEYTFNDSPQAFQYTITYSDKENFSTWEALSIKTYIKTLLGGVKIFRHIDNVLKNVEGDWYHSDTKIIGGTIE